MANYLDNKEFSQAIVDYSNLVTQAKNNKTEIPVVPDYIAKCFMTMAEGLSRRPNFIGYSYRDEMVMDGVMASLKAVTNFDPKATTKSGLPNAFGYFTQIMFYAFLQRISKEKRQQDIKVNLINSLDVSELFQADEFGGSDGFESATIDEMRTQFAKETPIKSKKIKSLKDIKTFSELEKFFEGDNS